MEFQSDYSNISHLMQTEEINHIEFSSDENVRTKHEVHHNTNGSMNGGMNSGNVPVGTTEYDLNEQEYENDLYNIFNKAKEYRQRMSNDDDMYGGASEDKRKNSPIVHIVGLAKELRAKKAYDNVAKKFTDYVVIASIIWKDAQEKAASEEAAEIKSIADKLQANVSDYTKKFQEKQKEKAKEKAASNKNTETSVSKRQKQYKNRSMFAFY